MRTKLVAAAVAVGFAAGGIAVGVMLTAGHTDPVRAAEPEKKADGKKAGGAARSAQGFGPWRKSIDSNNARAVRYTPAGAASEYGVEFSCLLTNSTALIPSATAVELSEFLKRMADAKPPEKTLLEEQYAYFTYPTLHAGNGTLTLALFDDKFNKEYKRFAKSLDEALKDVEALKKEEVAFEP
jgi:hypothetical protein